jgi:transcription elongation factor Elf1
MGRRRKSRRKIPLKPKKTLPRVFACPYCGSQLVNVRLNRRENKVLVSCGTCELEGEFNYIHGLLPVDYFNKFVDLYYQGIAKPKKEITAPPQATKVEINEEQATQGEEFLADNEDYQGEEDKPLYP